jgi:hypothetical protein
VSFWKKLFGGTEASAPPAAPSPGAAAPDPRDLFVAELRAFLVANRPVERVEHLRDDFALEVTTEDGKTMRMYLRNAFHDWRQAAPEQRHVVLARYTSSLVTPVAEGHEEPWDDVRDKLRPVVRACTFGAELGDKLLALPAWPYLMRAVGVDYPDRMRYVSPDDLAKWGKTAEEVYLAALEAFAPFGNVAPEQYDPDEKIWLIHGDSYGTSRLLLPGWLRAAGQLVEGRPIAAIPERDMLLIAGDAKPDVVRRLAATAKSEYQAASRSISPALYTLGDGDRVVPYVPEGDAAIAHDVMLGHKLLAAAEYDAQKQRLDALHERDGVDVFVATCTLARKEGSAPFTYATWGEEVLTLLPEVDLVVVCGGDPSDERGWSFAVPWKTVLEKVAACLERRDDPAPPRWLTKSWPTKEQLQALFAARSPILKGQPPA